MRLSHPTTICLACYPQNGERARNIIRQAKDPRSCLERCKSISACLLDQGVNRLVEPAVGLEACAASVEGAEPAPSPGCDPVSRIEEEVSRVTPLSAIASDLATADCRWRNQWRADYSVTNPVLKCVEDEDPVLALNGTAEISPALVTVTSRYQWRRAQLGGVITLWIQWVLITVFYQKNNQIQDPGGTIKQRRGNADYQYNLPLHFQSPVSKSLANIEKKSNSNPATPDAVGIFRSVLSVSSKQLMDTMRKVWKLRGLMESSPIEGSRFVLEFAEEGDFTHVTKGR
ncbi:hypothetical protein ACQ4PT_014754 [Festuca glaucescens]